MLAQRDDVSGADGVLDTQGRGFRKWKNSGQHLKMQSLRQPDEDFMRHQPARGNQEDPRLPRIAFQTSSNFPGSTGSPFQLLGAIGIIPPGGGQVCKLHRYLFPTCIKIAYEYSERLTY